MDFVEDELLPESILYIFDEMERCNVFYWLDAGTLFKGVRNKTILTSSDIDIAIHSEQIGNVLESLINIKKKGYKVQYNGGGPMLEDLVTIFLPYSVNRISSIDIYIYHGYKDDFIRRSYHKPIENSKFKYLFYLSKKIFSVGNFNKERTKAKFFSYFVASVIFLTGRVFFYLYERLGKTLWYVVPKQYFYDFYSFELHSKKFNIPSKYEEYLQFRYGESWKTPISREEWFPVWKKTKNQMLTVKRLSDLTSIKKYWIDKFIGS